MPLDRDLSSKNVPVFPCEPVLNLFEFTAELFDCEVFTVGVVLVALFYLAWLIVWVAVDACLSADGIQRLGL